MIYSPSSLNCFENCPRQFKFTYIDKPEIIKKEIIEAFLGNRVHDTLKKLYEDIRIGKIQLFDEILKFYIKEWDEKWNNKIEIKNKKYTADSYKKSGEICLKMYYERYYPFNRGEIVELENFFYFDLDYDKKYKFRGKPDRIMKILDGYYEIHDYKTSAKQNYVKDLKNDRQLPLYQFGLMSKFPDAKRVDLVWHYLRYNSEIRISYSAQDLENIKINTINLVKQIECEIVFEPNENPLCDWCDYIELCPAKVNLFKRE